MPTRASLIRDAPGGDRLRLLGAQPRLRFGGVGKRAVVLFGQRPHLGGGHIAGDDQDRVARRVVLPVEGDRVVAREPRHLRHPADHRPAIGVGGVERGIHLLGQQARRFIVDAGTAFLLHHRELGRHVLVLQHQIGHAIRFELHDQRQAVLRYALEIAGVILGGERVVVGAVAPDEARKLAGRIPGRALEQEMLEKVGDAGLALRLIGRAYLVPHHVGDDGRAMVGNDDDLHAVAELERLNIDVECSRRGKRSTDAQTRHRCFHRLPNATRAWNGP